MQGNGVVGEGRGGGANVRTKTSACEGNRFFVLFFLFSCGPHMEDGEKIKAAGFMINCTTTE